MGNNTIIRGYFVNIWTQYQSKGIVSVFQGEHYMSLFKYDWSSLAGEILVWNLFVLYLVTG